MISLPQRVMLDRGVSFEMSSKVTGISLGRCVAWVSGGDRLIPAAWLRAPEAREPEAMTVWMEDASILNEEATLTSENLQNELAFYL